MKKNNKTKNCTNCYYFNILNNPCNDCDAINGNYTKHITKEELTKKHDCKEHWYNDNSEIVCRICGFPQSEYFDAHNCYAEAENGFCGWCGKDLSDSEE